MKKRIIAGILALCALLTYTLPVSAAEAYPKREYFNLNVLHTDGEGYDNNVEADFMLLSDSENAKKKVYIKAEDFSHVTGADYRYEYNQTVTECAYASNSTGHVVRFMLNSPNAAVIYVGNNISYTAPYDILYEDGVTWLPFEFAVKLFHMQAIPENGTIHITSVKYNPLSVTNVVHREVRDLGFDWMDEVGESAFSNFVGKTSAGVASCANRLLSFELGEWGAVLANVVGYSYLYDSAFAEKIAKTFISPSQQELEEVDKQFMKMMSKSADAYDNMMTIEVKTNDVSDLINALTSKLPSLSKSKGVTAMQSALKKKDIHKSINNILAETGKYYDSFGEKAGKSVGMCLKFITLMEYYLLFLNKSDRAVAALEQYAEESDYEESLVFLEYASTTGSDFMDAVARCFMDNADNALDDTTKMMGVFGAMLETAGFLWDLISGVGPLKTGIDAVDSRTLSEYAIKYQDEALGLYYDARSKCIAESGANEETLDTMLNSIYAYLKFSYIARNAAAASFGSTADLTLGDWKENAQNNAKILNDKNQRIAEFLVIMEQDIFTPTAARQYTWDDTVYADTLKIHGTPIERPTQDTVPVFELPDFPGTEGIEYISEEEAIELVKEVLNRFSGGMLSMFGDFADEIYTYQVIDHYVNGEDMAYVVALLVGGSTDSLFFVSVIGNEVWLGTPTSDGGYFVYTELDLLHAGVGDLIATIGDLSGELFGEILKEELQNS